MLRTIYYTRNTLHYTRTRHLNNTICICTYMRVFKLQKVNDRMTRTPNSSRFTLVREFTVSQSQLLPIDILLNTINM